VFGDAAPPPPPAPARRSDTQPIHLPPDRG
jgi:hypothetical protein